MSDYAQFDELLAFAENGAELSDEQLDAVAGGGSMNVLLSTLSKELGIDLDADDAVKRLSEAVDKVKAKGLTFDQFQSLVKKSDALTDLLIS